MVTFYFDLAHHIAAASCIAVVGAGYWAPRWAARRIVARQVDQWQRGVAKATQKLPSGNEDTSVVALRSCAEDLKRQPAKVIQQLAEGSWSVPAQVPDAVEQYRRWLIAIAEGYVSLAVPSCRRHHLNKALGQLATADRLIPVPAAPASETPGAEPAAQPGALPRPMDGTDVSVGVSLSSAQR